MVAKSEPNHDLSRENENVVVLQGGGSLGAFFCGVFKEFAKTNLKINIIGGTSIGAINGAIIAGSKSDNPVKDLEDFWMEIAESNFNIIPNQILWDFDKFNDFSEHNNNKNYHFYKFPKIKEISSAPLNACFFGVPKMFTPRWNKLNFSFMDSILDFSKYYTNNWTYIYDHSPLEKTLEKYINYEKLTPKFKTNKNFTRLIVTAVNVLTAEPLIFDSAEMQIESKHLLASSGYPLYGFPWIEVENGIYAWDGSLLSNTPLREIMEASPRNDKPYFHSRKLS